MKTSLTEGVEKIFQSKVLEIFFSDLFA